MALLEVLKVSVAAVAGGSGAKEYYFQGSSVYADSTVATETGISVVKTFENDEPLCTIEQLILSKKIMHLVCEIEATVNGKKVRKTARIYAARSKAPALLGGNTLKGKAFTVKSGTTTKSLGTIKDVRTSTRDAYK